MAGIHNAQVSRQAGNYKIYGTLLANARECDTWYMHIHIFVRVCERESLSVCEMETYWLSHAF